MFGLIGNIIGLFKTQITADKEINEQIIQQRENNMADEILVIMVFIPVILLMFGIDVFPRLKEVPEWYQEIIMVTTIGIIGFNQVGNVVKKWKK